MLCDSARWESVAQNLKIEKPYDKSKPTKFCYRFKYLNRRYSGIITIENTAWDKRTRINVAKKRLEDIKERIRQGKQPDKNITVDRLFELYMENEPQSPWTKERHAYYRNHIHPHIGERKAYDLKPLEVERIIGDMEKRGLKPETTIKVIRILSPMYDFAIVNGILEENPIKRVKRPKVKLKRKQITNVSLKFVQLYNAIMELFKDDPYYRAIFLLGFFARRKNEVLSLKWENVDLINDFYWLERTKAGIKQKYTLYPAVKEALIQIPDKRHGYVFKSPHNPDTHIKEIKRQIKKLREYSGIDDLHFHRMRDIFASAMYENGVPQPIISNLLGHLNASTIQHYLSTDTYNASKEAYKFIDELLKGRP